MRKDKRKDDIHNYSFFLSFDLIWLDLRDWKKEIERLKEEKRSNDLRDDDERMGKRKKDKSRQ